MDPYYSYLNRGVPDPIGGISATVNVANTTTHNQEHACMLAIVEKGNRLPVNAPLSCQQKQNVGMRVRLYK